MSYKHLFGPVPSRRLGVSLGVDLVPFKVCTLNCIYCEVGATTNLTLERKEYIPIAEILAELDDYLSATPQLDYITFSGAGEPTLNSGIGQVIRHIKENYSQYRLALITNATLFYDSQLRAEIAPIDLVMPSLDAVTDLIFRKLNRPQSKLTVEAMIDGLIAFRQESAAEMWLEIFLSPGLNDSDEELTKLKQACQKINPDRVQLNSLDRPGVKAKLRAMSKAEMERVVAFLQPLPVEIIAKFTSRTQVKSFNTDIEEQILETISRRPCTDSDLCEMLGLHINELNKYLADMLEKRSIKERREQRGVFFEPGKKRT
jgi:wyosine [tRNA(Phe)-imidazoG37] synthetase (radical SAM superfamily)